MRFSLVVATINRNSELRQLLASLVEQRFKDFEVIIVDQNDDCRLTPLVYEFSRHLKILHIKTPTRGASHARNLGIERANGDIITFPDDDCEYPPSLLWDVVNVFDKHPDVGAISIFSRDKRETGGVARLGRRFRKVTKYNVLWSCVEAGIFVRTDCLQDVRFDEDMGVGADSPWWSDEGADFILQLLCRQVVVYYFPHLVIYHPDPARGYDEKAILRSFRYGCGRGYYLQKHRYPFLFVLYVWGLYVIGMIVSIFELNYAKLYFYYYGLMGRVFGYFRQKKMIGRVLIRALRKSGVCRS